MHVSDRAEPNGPFSFFVLVSFFVSLFAHFLIGPCVLCIVQLRIQTKRNIAERHSNCQ